MRSPGAGASACSTIRASPRPRVSCLNRGCCDARSKVSLAPIAAQTPEELEAAFRTVTAQQLDGFIVLTHGFAVLNGASHHRACRAATACRCSTAGAISSAEGGLMSYGPDIEGLVRGAARQVDRILKGASPADLPVEQPTRLISGEPQTAKALGLTIPPGFSRAPTR